MTSKRLSLGILLVILIAAVLIPLAMHKSSVPTVPETPVETGQLYTNSAYHFHFRYPSEFQLLAESDNSQQPWSFNTAAPGTRLVTVKLPQSFLPKTNFSEANISVGISTDPAGIKYCASTENTTKSEQVTLNGTEFLRTESGDAGAGNFYETQSYRTIKNGTCFALEAVIHSTNIGNYDPSQGITEFDKKKVQEKLEAVVNSFQFE